jgi:endonuclease III
MRTSRISQDTTRIFNAISPNTLASGRSTRSAKRLTSFALGYNGEVQLKRDAEEEDEEEDTGGLKRSPSLDGISELSATPDIEDAFLATTSTITAAATTTRVPVVRTSRKRKLGADTPVAASVTAAAIKQEAARVSPRKVKVEQKEEDEEEETTSVKRKAKAKPKKPARKHTSPSGTVTVEPPSNWSEMYDIIKAMRQRNPTAPVDTMGCEDLYWRGAPPKEKRYHTLTALMLSSQTKDTVTAVAMQRLHRELVPGSQQSTAYPDAPFGTVDEPDYQSVLTVANVINCDATHLDHLIGKVGFHNNKTKYIKQTATILQERYDSDIPETIEGLVALPGVGPKMGYLCLSAAWGIDQGIGVDVHVHRITNMWGWHKTKTPEETRLALQAWLPKDRWHEINKMLVGLGQTVCLPIGRRCGDCDLAGSGLCKAEIRGWKPTERRAVVKTHSKIEVGFEGEVDGVSVLKNELEDVPRIKKEE